ncbi:MAG: L-ribulose-5-phosphate 4-epimerase AraD [Limisphaerales bacterium]
MKQFIDGIKTGAVERLKQEVCQANVGLVTEGLVMQTWGNASGIDRARGLVVIKPSGALYSSLKSEHMVVVSLIDGSVVEGKLQPSSDTLTHLALYRAFKQIGGIVHTQSLYATAWAQAGRKIPSYGTTQAGYWHGEVPCTRSLAPREIKNDYELNVGKTIIETFRRSNPMDRPAVLVASHGPFTWGRNVSEAVQNAGVLEFIARLASETLWINPKTKPMRPLLVNKHFLRKHTRKAYHGRK